MRNWQRIRRSRLDLTDYVIHLTKPQYVQDETKIVDGRGLLLRILSDGYLMATFAPMRNRYNAEPQPTVRGSRPAVCLTEQPLWALLKSLKCFPGRYEGYGIAYHKVPLFHRGARPVIYGDSNTLARLPDEMKHLFVTYDPSCDSEIDPVDFTWEREWRIAPRDDRWHFDNHLELTLDTSAYPDAAGAVLVRYDDDVPVIERKLRELRKAIKPSKESARQSWRNRWLRRLRRIISLETAERMLATDDRYARIDT